MSRSFHVCNLRGFLELLALGLQARTLLHEVLRHALALLLEPPHLAFDALELAQHLFSRAFHLRAMLRLRALIRP